MRCISPSAISHAKSARRNKIARSSAGSVDKPRNARAIRSIVPLSSPRPVPEHRTKILKRELPVVACSIANVEPFDQQRWRHPVGHADERRAGSGKAGPPTECKAKPFDDRHVLEA